MPNGQPTSSWSATAFSPVFGESAARIPAQGRVTGVKTFIVSHDGTVYEKDLGPDTLKVFQGMDRFNPDKSWQPTDDEWPAEEPATQ